MNLKDAIRFHQRLQFLCTLASVPVGTDGSVTRTETTFLRSRVIPGADDLVMVDEPKAPLYADRIYELEQFYLYLLKEREHLGKLIREAKAKISTDLDLEPELNRDRYVVANALRCLAKIKPSEELIPDGGYGYTFNAEGNQVRYICDAKKVTTISYDPDRLLNTASLLMEQADTMKSRIEASQINLQLDYEPPFGEHDSFPDAFRKYLKKQEKDAQRCDPPSPFTNVGV